MLFPLKCSGVEISLKWMKNQINYLKYLKIASNRLFTHTHTVHNMHPTFLFKAGESASYYTNTHFLILPDDDNIRLT